MEAEELTWPLRRLGADLDDLASAGNGPGSYDVRGNVWHLGCCNPENKWSDQGWIIFGAIFGWTNNATGMANASFSEA